MDRESLNLLTRDELIAYARRTGVEQPEGMTRAELGDEIVRRTETDAERRRAARGWFGVARDLVASLVEQGLNLPDAAKLIRGDATFSTHVQAPIATVALAEIYAAQGHAERALRLLDQVLAKEPDHQAARRLYERLSQPVPPAPASVTEVTSLAETTPPPPERAEVAAAETEPSIVPDTTPPPARADVEETPAGMPPPVARAEVEEGDSESSIVPDTTPPPAPLEGSPDEASGVAAEPACDALFSIAGRERSHYVYWELSRATLERVRRLSPAGHPALKMVFFVPSRQGAQRSERVVSVRSSTGAVTLESPASNAATRVALGWQLPREFLPLVVATPLGPAAERSALRPSPRAIESTRAVQARALAAYRSAPAG